VTIRRPDEYHRKSNITAQDVLFLFLSPDTHRHTHLTLHHCHPPTHPLPLTHPPSSDNWLQGIAGTVHEVGHALYEQGRNAEYDNLPVSRALSMGVHESQSLLWERMVFQSAEFWEYATPLLHKHFPHTKGEGVR
jgi:Zn-dependent M32 family carboxypeptidase